MRKVRKFTARGTIRAMQIGDTVTFYYHECSPVTVRAAVCEARKELGWQIEAHQRHHESQITVARLG